MLEKLRERVKKGRETRSKKRAGRAARGERGEALENEGGVVELAAANCGEENGDAGEAGGNGFEAANGFEGPIENILRSGRPKAELTPDVPWLVIREARQNNLKGIDARIPLGRFTCVTGVSGSGKSSLVNDILYAGLARELNGAECTPGEFAGFAVEAAAKEGSRKGRETRAANGGGKPRKAKLTDYLDKIIAIDQTPIGRTPRSNPATYIKLFDLIRDLYTKLPDAKLRGYKPGRFSFNVASGSKGGGRCEACEGNGANKIEMDFLADVWVMCPVCEGRRFSRETLQIHYKGKSIADVLQMDVQQALEHFDSQPRIRAMLQTLHDVGLDYVKLGQSSTTLSGGEAQRIKLARELVRKSTGQTIYVLDEPTTGLHFEDIRKLLAVLHGFVDAGNTVIVIEHNLDVIKTADWLIDLGPEGGEAGGRIVCEGTPEDVAECAESQTGTALRELFAKSSERRVASSELKSRQAGVSAVERSSLATHNSLLDTVRVTGARQHNLRDITVEFPRNQMTVCTGVSGSGKTSFAIDTVFTEGYRRYVESLSSYARQFLGQLQKPKVEHVEGLSPAICIEQKAASKSPRSTVGTITEIYDYMRVLWARVGERYCPKCEIPIGTQTADEITDRVMAVGDGTPIILLAPVALGDGETWASLFNRLKNSGYTRVRIDGEIHPTAQATTLDARRKHRVEVVVDRTVVRSDAATKRRSDEGEGFEDQKVAGSTGLEAQAGPRGNRSRIAESVEHALALGNGLMVLLVEAVERVEPAPTNGDGEPVLSDALSPTPDDVVSRSAPNVTTTRAREVLFSQKLACTSCGTSYEELSPHSFSFNSPLGWCQTCEGLGVQRGAPAASIIRNPNKPLLKGAIAGWHNIDARSPFGRLLTNLCKHIGVDPHAPLADWTPAQRDVLLFGTQKSAAGGAGPGGAKQAGDGWIDGSDAFDGVRFHWRGFFPAIDAATRNSWTLRHRLHNVITDIPCLACRGGRVREDAAATRLGVADKRTIVEVCQWPLMRVAEFFKTLKLSATQRKIAGELLKEIRDRLQFLLDVGLDYLTLHRAAPTLSGGEAQRIRLASQIGSGLSGVLYVLDEPTIGLHPRDNLRLVNALLKLRNLGNTLLVVEHDREVIASADRLLDFGPRAGVHGGRIVAAGEPGDIESLKSRVHSEEPDPSSPSTLDSRLKTSDFSTQESLTAGYLSGALAIPIPTNRREIPGDSPGWLAIRGARQNNLRNIDVPIPLARLTCITGVSGSGKSSLINDILWPSLANRLNMANQTVGEHDAIEVEPNATNAEQPGAPRKANGRSPSSLGRSVASSLSPKRRDELPRYIDKAINVDQSPIGSTPSSNPATYTGAFDWIRELFARLPDSKMRGWNANRFSFNRAGGRCEACEGYGQKCIEMHFMPDVWVECETCRGKRYEPETLAVKFRGKSIADVLEMSVAQALQLFESVPKVRRMLQTLADVGLDYVQLGQPAPTLSGGEAQRVKLAAELGKPNTGKTFYILDEPTTGLHFDDVRKLMGVLQKLVDLGNTVLVVEHNLDVIKSADWIIDLGPEAGEGGGRVVVAGAPEEVAGAVKSLKDKVQSEASGRGGSLTSDFRLQTSDLPSHTAAALAPVLAAGPFEERPVYSAAQHAEEEMKVEKARFGGVGKAVKMPWQVDGRKWHLEQRTSRAGQPTKWQPATLEFVVDLIQQEGARFGKRRGGQSGNLFSETNWSERASVEISAPAAPTWFFHALTGGEWLLELYFRTPPGRFTTAGLNRRLGLKPLSERPEIQSFGSGPRAEARRRADGFDAIVVYAFDKAEVDTPAFREFVREVVAAYAEIL